MSQIIAAHIGSYPRIGDLKDHQRHRRGLTHYLRKEISAHAFRDVVQSVVQEAIAEQLEAGLDEITDGLISWSDPISYLASKCGGIRIGGLKRYFDTSFHYRVPVVTAKPKRKQPLIVDEIRYAKTLCTHRNVRAVLTGPITLAYHSQSDAKPFTKVSARISAFADILEEEIAALAKDGTAVIQVDEPSLLYHPDEAAAAKKIFERFLRKAHPSTLIVAASFLPKDPSYEILFDLPVDGVQLDVSADLKDSLAKIDRFRPRAKLGLGILSAESTREELPDPILNTLAPWLEKNMPETLYLATSSGLEFLPRQAAQNKLRAVARLKADLAKRLSLPLIHG